MFMILDNQVKEKGTFLLKAVMLVKVAKHMNMQVSGTEKKTKQGKYVFDTRTNRVDEIYSS